MTHDRRGRGHLKRDWSRQTRAVPSSESGRARDHILNLLTTYELSKEPSLRLTQLSY